MNKKRDIMKKRQVAQSRVMRISIEKGEESYARSRGKRGKHNY